MTEDGEETRVSFWVGLVTVVLAVVGVATLVWLAVRGVMALVWSL